MIAANNSGIKGGAAHPMGVEKAIRAQEIALRNKLPYVQLVESAGANLMLQAEMFVRGGATFANMARLSAAGDSGRLDRARLLDRRRRLSDRPCRLCRDGARPLESLPRRAAACSKAATGEIADDEALGGAELHCATTGLGEYLAEDDADALRIGREILARDRLGGARAAAPSAPPPLYDPEELLGIVPVDYRKPYDVREVVARLVDGSEFLDFKPSYGAATVCGHAAIEGAADRRSSATTARSTRPARARPASSSSSAARPACRSSSCRTRPAISSASRPRARASSSTARR